MIGQKWSVPISLIGDLYFVINNPEEMPSVCIDKVEILKALVKHWERKQCKKMYRRGLAIDEGMLLFPRMNIIVAQTF